MDHFGAHVLAYCQMGNHFHLVLHTPQPNLSRLMRHLNGVYTQAFNRRHGLAGHPFQGRFKGILVDRDAYLSALCRYVQRNPVAAKLVAAADQWRWSSCQAHLRQVVPPPWLDSDGLHAHLRGRAVETARDRKRAINKAIPKAQRPAVRTWATWLAHCEGRRYEALAQVCRESGMMMTALGREASLSVSHVGRLIQSVEAGDEGTTEGRWET